MCFGEEVGFRKLCSGFRVLFRGFSGYVELVDLFQIILHVLFTVRLGALRVYECRDQGFKFSKLVTRISTDWTF